MMRKWLAKRMRGGGEGPSMLQFAFSLCFFSAFCCGMGHELMREGEWLLRHTIMAYSIRDVVTFVLWSVVLIPPMLFVGILCRINQKYSPKY